MKFTKDLIKIDPVFETERIVKKLKDQVAFKLHKKGAVVGVSGGIDSSVVLGLCVNAFGAERVFALMLPEKDSSPDSLDLAKSLTSKFNVQYKVEEISGALDGFGCYKRRDEAVKRIFPEYNNSYKMKISIPKDDEQKGLINFFNLSIVSLNGEEKTQRLPLNEYLQIVAASNFKQRSRMCMLYYYAELKNYSVIGTGNKNEHEQGFFVKHGDGAADVKPIAHLFKTQIYQLAKYLQIPDEIQKRTPTTDTYSAEQTQEEFFFKLPFEMLDRIWLGWEKDYPVSEIAEALSISEEQVNLVITDIKRKIQTTEYLRHNPISLE